MLIFKYYNIDLLMRTVVSILDLVHSQHLPRDKELHQ